MALFIYELCNIRLPIVHNIAVISTLLFIRELVCNHSISLRKEIYYVGGKNEILKEGFLSRGLKIYFT
ncbi:MAG: hypothetical protein DRJ66_02125 [Thermoprotei archaeon]|nr:MAG: hypothetical protein DRJ66_02125 [Thermoprotei archaeon]RLF20464.1 MAG: hypothetical protein DRZ82_02165 [Thermoprotei archaeon]